LGTSKKVTLSVDAAAGRHAISPLVYGVNFGSQTSGLNKVLNIPVDRWGGNSTSRYNYTNGFTNTGADWYFENVVSDQSLTGFVDADRSTGTKSLVTVPMIGWVAKNGSATEHPFTCSFPKAAFPVQDGFDHWDPDCGTGTRNGTDLTADPSTTSTQVGSGFDQAMVASLVSRYGTAASGGVGFYELDNEPVIWNSTHRDVHPDPLTASELREKSLDTAKAIKAADPSAAVLGPSDWGWCAYYFSGAQDCGQAVDADVNGAEPLGVWYLKQFAAAQQSSGARLLDYFDEHFYPQAPGVALGRAGSAATQALRLRSTRSLWDPSYVDESWIGTDVGAEPLAWIRTMKAWVNASYPGTRTAITEYNFGGLESVNGALAQADVLGIFGREGLDLATLWAPEKTSEPWAYAFRMYRNYDGRRHTFGDLSVKASSSNQGRLAAYAATRSSDGALTVVVINKTHAKITSRLSLKNFAGRTRAAVYRYSSAHKTSIRKLASAKVHAGRVTLTYPASSISLLVLPKR